VPEVVTGVSAAAPTAVKAEILQANAPLLIVCNPSTRVVGPFSNSRLAFNYTAFATLVADHAEQRTIARWLRRRSLVTTLTGS